MKLRNAAQGYLEMEGVFTGIFITMIFGIIGILLLTFGSINVNNKKDPNFTDIDAGLIKTDKSCKRYYTNGSCKLHKYVSTYDTSMCTNMPNVTTKDGQDKSLQLEQHRETDECKSRTIGKSRSVVLIIFGILFTLCALSTAYCTYKEDCRAFLGIMGMSGAVRNGNGGMMSGIGNAVGELMNKF